MSAKTIAVEEKQQVKRKPLASFLSFLTLNNVKSGARSTLNSIWAVVFGLIVGIIFTFIAFNENGFEFIINIFRGGFDNLSELAILFVVFGIASIGVGLSFKSGLFNIGIPGQMMLAGTVAFMLIGYFGNLRDKGTSVLTNDALAFLILFASGLVGFAFALIPGFLKAYFKIHEVVSTIILNWIAVYLCLWVWRPNSPIQVNMLLPKGDPLVSGFFLIEGSLFNSSTAWIIGLVLLVIISASVFVVLKYTSLGYKVKMNGINVNASSYAGVNQKLTTILTMGFGGLLAGFAAFFYFVFKQGRYSIPSSNEPLVVGFDTIAIALLGNNSPIGIVFSSFFYGILKNSDSFIRTIYSSSPNISRGGLDVLVGVIIYFAALSNVFASFRPIHYFTKLIGTLKQKWYKEYYFKTYLPRKKQIKEETRIALLHAKALYKKNSLEYKRILSEIKQIEREALQKIQIQTHKNFGTNLEKINKLNQTKEQLVQNISILKQRILWLQDQLYALGYQQALSNKLQRDYEIKLVKYSYISEGQKIDKTEVESNIKEIEENFNKWINIYANSEKTNAKSILEIKGLIKQYKKEIQSLTYILDNINGKLSSKNVETIFSDLSKQKLALKEELEKLGYYQISDIKNLSKSKLKILHTEKTKNRNLAWERFKFAYTNIIFLSKTTNSVYSHQELINACETDLLIYKNAFEQGKITQEEYDAKINSIEDILSKYRNVKLVEINFLKQEKSDLLKFVKKAKSEDTSAQLERISQIDSQISELENEWNTTSNNLMKELWNETNLENYDNYMAIFKRRNAILKGEN